MRSAFAELRGQRSLPVVSEGWCGRGDSCPKTEVRSAEGRVPEPPVEHYAERVVRKGGLEPARYCYRQPLKLVDLPC